MRQLESLVSFTLLNSRGIWKVRHLEPSLDKKEADAKLLGSETQQIQRLNRERTLIPVCLMNDIPKYYESCGEILYVGSKLKKT